MSLAARVSAFFLATLALVGGVVVYFASEKQ